jgi:hypothetical protein
LRAQIAALQKQLRERPAVEIPPPEIIEKPVLVAGEADALRDAAESMRGTGDAILGALARLTAPRPQAALPPPRPIPQARPEPRVATATASDEGLGKAHRTILIALAQTLEGCDKAQLGILAGYSPNSGHFNNVLGSLRTSEFINRGDPIQITDAGLNALGRYDPLPIGEDLRRYWLGRLGKAEGAILNALFFVYPEKLTKGELGERSGYSTNSGHFNNVLGKLRTLKLIEGHSKIKAADALF